MSIIDMYQYIDMYVKLFYIKFLNLFPSSLLNLSFILKIERSELNTCVKKYDNI